MNTKILIAVALISIAGFTTYAVAQTIIGGVVVNTSWCQETDTGLDYSNRGTITGYFYLGNWSFFGNITDSCLDNFTLVEGVCGSSLRGYGNLSAYAGAFVINCSSGNFTGCSMGRCV